VAFVLWVTRFERLHERRHRKEVVATDIERERRMNRVAMEIGKIVRVGFGERQAAYRTVIVRTVLPRWIDALAMRDAGGAGCRIALRMGRSDDEGADGAHHAQGKRVSVDG
jgi:hypothetical protein